MENTFTYTARSASDPGRVITFTLHDHSLSLQSMAMEERLAQPSDGNGHQMTGIARVGQLVSALRPRMGALELAEGPFSLADVRASASGDGLHVIAWRRGAGLRTAPLRLDVAPVDNPQGAKEFVDELTQRQAEAADTRKLPGPMDYWLGWFLLLAVAATVSTVAKRELHRLHLR